MASKKVTFNTEVEIERNTAGKPEFVHIHATNHRLKVVASLKEKDAARALNLRGKMGLLMVQSDGEVILAMEE